MPILFQFLPFKGQFDFVMVRTDAPPPTPGGCNIKLVSGDNLLLMTGDALIRVVCVATVSYLKLVSGDFLEKMDGDKVRLVV